jgi:hypothetical protein
VRPDVSQGWVDRKRVELGEASFAQEYGAQFVEAGGQFFSLDGVEFAPGPAAPEDGRNWIAGLDPAFHADKFGVALVGESVEIPGLLVLGRCEGVAAGAKRRSLALRRGREDATLERIAKLLEPYGPARVVSDQHQADAIRSYFGRLGYAVTIMSTTAASQTAAFTSTRSRIVDGSLLLWEHPALIEELRRVRARGESIQLPKFGGSHCDIAAALALAVFQLRHVSDTPPGEARGGGRPITAGIAAELYGGLYEPESPMAQRTPGELLAESREVEAGLARAGIRARILGGQGHPDW